MGGADRGWEVEEKGSREGLEAQGMGKEVSLCEKRVLLH